MIEAQISHRRLNLGVLFCLVITKDLSDDPLVGHTTETYINSFWLCSILGG